MNILYKNILCFVCILRHYITCLRIFVQNIKKFLSIFRQTPVSAFLLQAVRRPQRAKLLLGQLAEFARRKAFVKPHAAELHTL